MKHIKNLILLILIILVYYASALAQNNKPYVLLISFDGFRWDYVYRNLTPNLNSFADNGSSAISLMPCFPSTTFPNHYSIITGMYPENHGIISNSFIDARTNELFSYSNEKSVQNNKFYLGEAFWETARRYGIITASYFWVGSEINLDYRRPNYSMPYKHNDSLSFRFNKVVEWLKMPDSLRPHLITLYFHEPDASGHSYGPYSDKVNEAIHNIDSSFGVFFNALKEINMLDSINIIVVSDHGMSEVDSIKKINISTLLGSYKCKIQNYGTYSMLEPINANPDEIYQLMLNTKLANAELNHFDVYLKKNIPERFHFSRNPCISDIIIIAEPGWLLFDNKSSNNYKDELKGAHGYDNYFMDMHGIFLANGPAFKKNYKIGTLRNIDIYPLLCKIFSIDPRSNIDGKLENIEDILK